MLRTLGFKYKVLRGNAEFAQLLAMPDASPPNIRMNDTGAIKVSFSGTFLPLPDGVDLLSDEIAPVLIVDGVEHQLGVFMPATVSESEDAAAASVSIEAYDRSWRLSTARTEALQYFAAGTNYLDAVKLLLTDAGVTTVIETPTAATLAEARQDWDVGTSYLEIVNQLLSEINYKEIWFNASGAAVLEPVVTPTAENITHTLDDTEIASLMLPSLRRSTDLFSAPNVFVCICSNPDKPAALTATAENDNPYSPLSITRRGRRIVSVEYVDNIASQTELEAYVARRRNGSMIRGETLIVQTALLPGYGVDETTALYYKDFTAICLERGFTMDLRVGGVMTHTLERVVYVLE